MRTTRMRAAFCALVSLVAAIQPVAMATADPQADQVEQLALEYLKTGAKDPTNSQAVGEAGIDFSVGVISLGLASLGVPGAGAVIALLGGLFSSDTASVPPAVDLRLDAVETDVRGLQANVKALTIDIANNDNLDRLSGLEPIAADIGRDARALSEVPQMSDEAKRNLVENALADANRFLPGKGAVAKSLWQWTNVRVRGNPQSHNVSTTTETVSNMNLALPLYLQSIAVLAAAIDATGVHPEPERLRPHLYFLGGQYADSRPKGLTPLPELAEDISCKAIAPAKPTPDGKCDVPVRCISPVTAVSKVVQFPQNSFYENACTIGDPYLHRPLASVYFDSLIAEVKKNIEPVKDLMYKAAVALNRAGTVPAVFDMTFYDADWLFAVDSEGRLFKYRHLIVTRPFHKDEKPKPYSRMVVDTARLDKVRDHMRPITGSAAHSDKASFVGVKVAPGAVEKVRAIRPDVAAFVAKPPPISHELSRAKLDGDDWGDFVFVIVSEWVGDDLIVYGLKTDGDLIWRRISGTALGNVTSAEWLATAADPVKQAAQRVGNGWNSLKNVFSTGEGVVYGVASNGDLIWYRHKNNEDGNAPPQWGHHVVGVGWGGFTLLFSPGKGVIYAVKPDGTLVWYRHHGYLTGAGIDQPGAWEGPKTVGSGWQGFKQVFAAGRGHIYAINAAGELLYYNHKGWPTGAADWDAPVKLGDGWGDYTQVFAAMGGKPPVVR